MKFGYTVVYVPDVKATLDFYGRAFGLGTRFLHDSRQYGELDTGPTTLAFASDALGATTLPGGYVHTSPANKPLGIELALTTDDVPSAFAHALAAGATPVSAPAATPWGQTVAYLRTPDGTLIELCTPVT